MYMPIWLWFEHSTRVVVVFGRKYMAAHAHWRAAGFREFIPGNTQRQRKEKWTKYVRKNTESSREVSVPSQEGNEPKTIPSEAEREKTFKGKFFEPLAQLNVGFGSGNLWTDSHRKDQSCCPTILKTRSASSSCLPTKNLLVTSTLYSSLDYAPQKTLIYHVCSQLRVWPGWCHAIAASKVRSMLLLVQAAVAASASNFGCREISHLPWV